MRFRLSVLVVLAATALLRSAGSAAMPDGHAPIMPLAPESLLLDITTAGDRIVAAGERGHILYSDDGGRSWIQAAVPTTQMLTSIYFISPQRGWAAGHDGLILVSDDGGAHWRVQRDGIAVQQQANLELREAAYQQVDQLQQALAAANDGDREELEMALDDAVMDLEDADLALKEAPFASPLMDIWFQDRDRGWAVGAFGTLLATRNGGKQWSNEAGVVDNPDEFHLNAVTGDGAGRVFIAGEGGVMYRSFDGGENWETLEPFYGGSWFGAVYNPVNEFLLVFGLRGHLYRSADFGTSWQPVIGKNQMTLAGGNISDDGRIVLVGAVGAVLRSSDGGLSFDEAMLPERLSLSSALWRGDRQVLVGQGGIRVISVESRHD